MGLANLCEQRMHIFLVRHCQATGQDPDAPLTLEGHAQAERLAELLADAGIRRIVSSPFARARDSIQPLASRLGVALETDARLAERVVCGEPRPDWRDRLRDSFDDLDICLPGGESSRAAGERGVAAVQDAIRSGSLPVVLVTHGNLLTLILRRFDRRFGFREWERLTNPDVFRLSLGDGRAAVERIWAEP
jgi:2,3-bisphosphoglycerate-dependent phosphoglycerate mutase